MRKKNYKGAKVSKRVVAKCEGVCRTYDARDRFKFCVNVKN